mgnify:CR=1 FL=1|tara:strand:- start:338 stop:598 length:261 start_codon:yes stop_codon:yes gene_type:complete
MINDVAILNSIVGVILNVVLSVVFSAHATPSQIKPPNGAENLEFFDQIMHMLVHHKQVLLTSSLIIFAIIFISTHTVIYLKKNKII